MEEMLETFTYDGVEYQLPSKDGLVFKSVAAALRVAVRGRTPIYDTGVLIGHEKELVADFGDQNAPVLYDEQGDPHVAIRGNFCHTLLQGEEKGWTDEERALVEKKLLANQRANHYWLHTAPKPKKPWPTYDETEAGKIAGIAEATGTVAEALAYERANKKRPTVVGALKKLVEARPAEEPTEEELAAA
jgi:hypothetical protein